MVAGFFSSFFVKRPSRRMSLADARQKAACTATPAAIRTGPAAFIVWMRVRVVSFRDPDFMEHSARNFRVRIANISKNPIPKVNFEIRFRAKVIKNLESIWYESSSFGYVLLTGHWKQML